MRKKAKMILAAIVLVACLAGLVIVGGHLIDEKISEDRATITPPSPNADSQLTDDVGYPVVDWAAYQAINPDVVGWITIPGTTIDCPILQARPSAPNYYLKHDYTKAYNAWGAVYVDAGCEEGLNSKAVVIYGHNMSKHENKMFGEVSQFSSYDFAVEHQEVLLQTPEWKKRVKVAFSTITPGWESSNRKAFEDDADFTSWFLKRFEAASMSLVANPDTPDQVFTLCTCSYTTYSNERTLVYAY